MSPLINEGTDLVMRFGAAAGQTIVSAGSPLTRLNYFDGKFLRADDLRREQAYLRQLVQFSNQGLGAGVVYGIAGMTVALVATVVLAAGSLEAGAVALLVAGFVIGGGIGLWRARVVDPQDQNFRERGIDGMVFSVKALR